MIGHFVRIYFRTYVFNYIFKRERKNQRKNYLTANQYYFKYNQHHIYQVLVIVSFLIYYFLGNYHFMLSHKLQEVYLQTKKNTRGNGNGIYKLRRTLSSCEIICARFKSYRIIRSFIGRSSLSGAFQSYPSNGGKSLKIAEAKKKINYQYFLLHKVSTTAQKFRRSKKKNSRGPFRERVFFCRLSRFYHQISDSPTKYSHQGLLYINNIYRSLTKINYKLKTLAYRKGG